MDNYGYSKKKKRRKRNIAIHNFLTYLSWCIGKEPRPVSLNNSADSAHPPHSFANKNQPLRPPPPPKTHPGIIFDIKPLWKSSRKSRLSTAQDKHGFPSKVERKLRVTVR